MNGPLNMAFIMGDVKSTMSLSVICIDGGLWSIVEVDLVDVFIYGLRNNRKGLEYLADDLRVQICNKKLE
uniref:Reverse transcriptase n=1 Tax=Strongyloides venezuelensis TaxID=75913 RepID=A0A0K0G5M4_STRVS